MEGNAEANTILPRLQGKVTKIPEADTTFSKEGYFADAKATGEALAKKVNSADIVNNLLTASAEKPLSAEMGKKLKEQIDDVDPHYAENVQYDNTTSGLAASDVQGAIDELANKCKKSGWINANLQTPFESYMGSSPVRYRKVGNVVEVLGIVSVTSELESSNINHTMFTVDNGYRPTDTLSILCQGSGVESWLLTVGSDGKISASRYRDASGYKKFGVGIWLPFHVTFLVE